MQLFRDKAFFSQLSGRDAELLAELMGLETAKTEMARGDAKKREQIFAAIIGMLLTATRHGPLVLMLDDGQWLDATSLDLLARLVSKVADSPILLIITARPEFKPIWQDQPHVTVLSLGRLKKKDSTALIAAVANSSRLSPAFADQIYARTDGVPLFVEELTKALVERGDLDDCNGDAFLNRASAPVIPSSLQGSLLARLDRLGEAKRIVQIGAAIGREFSYKVLQSVVGLEERQLTPFLNVSVESGLLYVQGAAPEAYYIFKHALLQDAAYETILKKQRRQLHAKIALRILEDCRLKGVSYPGIVAHHLTLAEDYPAAIEHWLEFGKAQVLVSGDVEAIAIFRKALSLLDKIADTSLRNRLELQLQVAIVGSLVAIKGPPSDEVAKCCDRGLELARGFNDPALIFPFFYGQYVHSISRGSLRRSADIASDLINTSRSRRYKSGEVLGHRLLGLSLAGLAAFERARKALETALRDYTPERDDTITYRYGQNPKISSQTVLSLVLYLIGDVKGCVEIGEECVEAAEKLNHPHTLAIAIHYYGCDVCSLLDKFDKTYAYSQKVVAVSKEYGFGYFGVVGSFYTGLSKYKRGEAGGLLQMEEGLAALEKMAFRVGVPFYLTFLVEAKIEQGLFHEALDLACKAERVMKSTEECWIEPEVLSVKGSALLHAKPDELDLARRLLEKAILKAREIGSPTLELRCLLRRDRLFSGRGAR
jgi:tetratricopeptide (TPR) repeat protein